MGQATLNLLMDTAARSGSHLDEAWDILEARKKSCGGDGCVFGVPLSFPRKMTDFFFFLKKGRPFSKGNFSNIFQPLIFQGYRYIC